MKFTLYKDKAGEWRWSLASRRNGRIVADGGEGYKRFSSMLRTLRRVFADGVMRAELELAVTIAKEQ